jgi:hypothetical protein
LPLDLASMLQSQEHSLLEHSVGHDFAQGIVLLSQVLLASEAEPLHEGLALHSLFPTEANGHHEVVLRLPRLHEVSPSAKVMAQLGVLFTIRESCDDFGTSHLVAKDSLPVIEEGTPEVKVLLPSHVVYITVDEAVSFVVLVNNVECFAVPQS